MCSCMCVYVSVCVCDCVRVCVCMSVSVCLCVCGENKEVTKMMKFQKSSKYMSNPFFSLLKQTSLMALVTGNESSIQYSMAMELCQVHCLCNSELAYKHNMPSWS